MSSLDAPESDHKNSQMLQQLQRNVNCLSETNRSVRTQSLGKIQTLVLAQLTLPKQDLTILLNFLSKPLLKLFSDQVEKCRESSINIMMILYESLNANNVEKSLIYLVPVIVSRLANQELKEPTEEIRLELLNLLILIVIKSPINMIKPYFNDVILILQFTVTDPFAEVKKASCNLIEYIAPNFKENFYTQGELLIKPILSAVGHQHSKVRIATLKALCVTYLYGGNAAGKRFEEAMFHLAQRTFDSIPAVRICFYELLWQWLLNLPDRYSFWSRLLPIFISGLSDEVADIREMVNKQFDEVAAKYEEENETQLKDYLDYPKALSRETSYPRPRLGRRVLIQENFSKIIPAVFNDIVDWHERNRRKAAELLFTLILHEEDYITQHIPTVLLGFYKSLKVQEVAIKMKIDASAELIGGFIGPEIWLTYVTSAVLGASGSASNSPVSVSEHTVIATLRVFSHLIKGSSAAELTPYTEEITKCLTTYDLSQTNNIEVLDWLLMCVSNLVEKIDVEYCRLVSYSLFCLLLSISSKSSLTADLRSKALLNINNLATKQNITISDLFKYHTSSILEEIEPKADTWLNTSDKDFLIFSSILCQAGNHLGSLLSVITKILSKCLHPDRDSVIRLELFRILSDLLTTQVADTLNSTCELSLFFPDWLHQFILPNFTWRIGRVTGGLRTAAVSCFWAMLKTQLFPVDLATHDALFAKIPTILDDDNVSTRIVAVKVVKELFSIPKFSLTTDKLHSLYPHFSKRLDDSNNEVRVATCKLLIVYFNCLHKDYNIDLYRLVLEDMYEGLILHLDDPLQEIQEEILAVLKIASLLNPSQLKNIVTSVRDKHRVKHYCDNIIAHIDAMQK